jgi:hypothetical protein
MPNHAFLAICKLQGREEAPKLDHIGVSTLLGPPLIRYLSVKHHNDMVFDVADTMNAIQGQMGHLLFDKVESATITEVNLETTFEGQKIRGRADYYDPATKTLGDSKFRQVNSVLLEKQLNVYRWMAERSFMVVNRLQGDIYINGWVRYKAYGNPNYPQAPYQKIDVPMWSLTETENFVRERLAIHRTMALECLRLNDHDPVRMAEAEAAIPICTDEERYMQPTKYAVMKEGQKKAVKLFDSQADADRFITTFTTANANKLAVVERKGGYIRCMSYCPVRAFCAYAPKEITPPEESA